jgi:signal transduction histidine kinase
MEAYKQARTILSEAPQLLLTSFVLVTFAAALYAAVPSVQKEPTLYAFGVIGFFACGLPLGLWLFRKPVGFLSRLYMSRSSLRAQTPPLGLLLGLAVLPLFVYGLILIKILRDAHADPTWIVVAGFLAIVTSGAIIYLVLRTWVFQPVSALRHVMIAAANGHLDERVQISTRGLADLGESFNAMADRLVEFQERLKRQERQAVFGRIAAGLVHDLSHPVQNIGNSLRLLLRDDVDAESREMFRRTIDRELATLMRFLDDLGNISRTKPIERFPLDINASVAEIVDSMRTESERAGVAVEGRYASGPLVMEGDRFALGRMFRHLITNAIQATAPGGRIAIVTARVSDHIEVRVSDTGSGIAPDRLESIFDNFITTKRRGLGLGLAISKRIIEQLDGTVGVESVVGRGTTFTLRFPITAHRPGQNAIAM